MKTFLTVVLTLGLGFAGCTRQAADESPAKVLENYIKISFNATSIEDKTKMEELLTGDSKTRLASWSDEQFLRAFVEAKRKFSNLRILENKKITDQEYALTYELSYEEGVPEKKSQISQRKLCTVVEVDGLWKIKEVRSIRESIEFLKELSLP